MSVSSDIADVLNRKKIRYCRLADTNKWEQFDSIALPDATFAFYQSNGSFMNLEGIDYSFPTRAEFTKFFSNLFKDLQVIHVVGAGDLEQVGPDEVRGVWTVVYHAGMKDSDTELHHTGGGHYYDTWKRKGDDWFISDLRFERSYFKPLA